MNTKETTLKGAVPKELAGKFRQAKMQLKKLSLLKGAALLAGCLFVSFIIAVILDRLFWMPSLYRLVVVAASLSAMFFVLAWFLAIPLLRRYSARRIAISIEDANPQLGDSLLTTVELTEEVEQGVLKTSPELVQAHALKTCESVLAVDFRSIAPFHSILKVIIFAALSILIVGGFYIVKMPIAKNVFARLIHPFAGPEVFTYTKISVEPGSIFVKKGDDVQVSASLSGRIPERGNLYWKTGSRTWERVLIGQKKEKLAHKFNSLLVPISYKFSAGDARSEVYVIEPVVPPAVVSITPKIIFPSYTRAAPKTLRDSGGAISAVKGSKVIVTAMLNKPCKSASIVWIHGEKLPMQISGSIVRSGELNIDDGGTYSFELTDELGFVNSNPTYFRVEALKDTAPTIVVEKPPQYIEAIPDAIVLITFSVVDDFGIEKVWIDYTIDKQPEVEEADILPENIIKGVADIRLENAGAASIHADYNFLLADLSLKSGDVVTFRLKSQDGDNLAGPNTGESEEIKIKIISDEESFDKIVNDQEDISRRIKLLIKKQTENEDSVEQITKMLQSQNDISKTEKENLTSARKTQEEIGESDRDIAADVDKVVARMQQNPMIGLQSVIQMNDVRKALENLADDEMASATDQMKGAEKADNSSSRNQSLAKTSKLQDEIIKKLEQIDEQMSKMQKEEMIASVALMGRGLAKKQDENIKNTEGARDDLSGMMPEEMGNKEKRTLKKLVDKEKKLTEELEQLEQRMQKMDKQMKGDESAGNVGQAMKQMKEDKIGDDMKEAEESLRANHLNKGMDAQKSASKKLWDMVKTLEKQKQQQFSSEFKNIEARMREQIAEIDRLIELQTKLLDETLILPIGDETDPLNDRHIDAFPALGASQSKLQIRCNEFTQKLQAIFENLVLFDIDPISPLKKAVVSMEEASVCLIELKQPPSVAAEKEALKQLETARDELAKAISKLMEEAELQQMMQQMGILDEMIEKQLKINKETKEVDDRIKPDQPIPDTLQRLSKKLSRLQKELADTADSLKEQLKQMKEISELMGEVSKLLDDVKTGKKTQSMQDDIIERLVSVLMQLQMQMSGASQAMGMGVMGGSGGGGNRSGVQLPVQRRDRPEGISDDQWAKLSEKLKKELLDAWSEEYPPRFRALLSVYYRRLAEEENR